MKIKTELEKLKSVDIYSLLMFVLFKVKDVKEYSTMSELCYLLDKNNFLKLCEYFGGLTITIPTIEEVEDLIMSLLLYQQVDIDGQDYDTVLEDMCKKSTNMKKIKANYAELKEVLKNYEFVNRK
jgi:acid stress-induced BolA-like protein IbaG/YrbA